MIILTASLTERQAKSVGMPKKQATLRGGIGSDGRDRTYDQLINSQLLYR